MRHHILAICFFPAFNPPASGGELRLLNLYRALAERFTVTLLTSTDFGARQEEFYHSPHFREIRFPKDKLWRSAYAKLEKSGIYGDLSGLAFALAVNDPTCALRVAARALAPSADHIIHEFPFSEPIFSDGLFARKEIYNSHNFEASLLSAIVNGSGFETAFLKLCRLEGGLVRRAQRVFATAQADADKFRLFYGVSPSRLGICPNGFDETELASISGRRSTAMVNDRPKLLFFGSAHHPNVEAANALIAMAPSLDDCDIVIAGGVSQAIASSALPPNVLIQGPFDEARKLALLAEADLFLNPVVLGSGTSLKALEALGAGIPLLSTPGGVRGLDLESGHHAVIVERKAFPDAIRAMLAEPERAEAMGRVGQDFVMQRYTWRSIAERISADLGAPVSLADAAPRQMVLAFNDYPVLDASWGGKARIRNLLAHIDADIVLLTFGGACDIVLLGANVLHIVVPKTREHVSFEEAANEGQSLSVNDCVAALFVGSNRIMGEIAASLARRSQALVFEHCYMAPILDGIDQVRPNLPIVYSAHNVEAEHRVSMLAAHTAGRPIGGFVKRLEEMLVRRAALVVCCTEADARYFAQAGAQTLIVANGCVLPSLDDLESARPFPGEASPRVGFMGSSHGPNVEAASFVVNQLAPAFPMVTFELLGGVGEALRDPLPNNVVLRGIVDDDTKTQIMAGWSVALNPLSSGGGSSLKLPDFMAHGLATISTASGARGFEIDHQGAGVIVEHEGFERALRHLLSDPAHCHTLGANAYRYAQTRLSWEVIVKPYAVRLNDIIRRSDTPEVAQRSLLIVTYRYTEPPLGGAEEYLVEVLKLLRPRFSRIDLAAVDVGQVTNEHHFGIRITDANAGASARITELFDKAHFFSPDIVPDDEAIERCRRLQRQWSVGEFDLYLPFAKYLTAPNKLRLFSGFYWPENHGSGIRRWSSPSFSFLLPKNASSLRLVGFGDRPKTMALTLIRVTADLVPEIVSEHQYPLSTWFTMNVSLPQIVGDDALIVHCDVDEHHADGDHRPFGVLLESASVLTDPRDQSAVDAEAMSDLNESLADLGEDKDQQLRTEYFEEWVSALNTLGRRNSASIEADFAAVRGPHSVVMQGWIAAHREEYDTILVQGIPFDVIPRTVETLQHFPDRPRIVLLPHFHGDDRFYHWRRYIEAFDKADSSLLFSRSIADRLGVAGRIDVVPGGGVRTTEQGDVTAVKRFRDIYPATAPFFLVLGRKTPSKGYDRIIAAHSALRARGHMSDLVLIGPDEDGRMINQEGVVYLGRQPREVIRGALSECRALVSMSTSESFGIVLCEAWLFSKPVIANRACYSFRELVRDGQTGLLVGGDHELTDAMETLLRDSDQADALGRSGRRDVLKSYAWPQVAKRIYEVLVDEA